MYATRDTQAPTIEAAIDRYVEELVSSHSNTMKTPLIAKDGNHVCVCARVCVYLCGCVQLAFVKVQF